MVIGQLISDDIPPLKTDDSAEKALRWMDEFKVSWLPVVDGTEFVGIISESELFELDESDSPISSRQLSLIRPVLNEGQHAYDALKLMAELNVDVIGILDENGQYCGAVTIRKIAEHLAKMAALREPGGILVLEVNNVDYSLSQIAQIVEGNDAKILSAYVAGIPGTPRVEITLKINREDLSRIIQTFERYNYQITGTFHQSVYEEDLKERYDEFMNYIRL
jgi:CBS-domain-containing membrane protein